MPNSVYSMYNKHNAKCKMNAPILHPKMIEKLILTPLMKGADYSTFATVDSVETLKELLIVIGCF
jgi:hypothetical protein